MTDQDCSTGDRFSILSNRQDTLRKFVFRSYQSPGDILMLTAAVRDLHIAYPEQFKTDVRTSSPQLWAHNPYLTPLEEDSPDVSVIDMHYPLIHQSNHRPYHFLHGYAQYLEQQLDLRIPVTRFHADLYLSEEEKQYDLSALGIAAPFWIVMAGGKYDFTTKWWNPECYQSVVDAFIGKIQFVQCGLKEHWHPPLKHVVNLVGDLNLREVLQLMYRADGVLCPVTFAMHAAAALETPPGRPRNRACVVIAGGREPPHWEAYPHHRFLNNNGALSCSQQGGCWKSRCQTIGDGDEKDRRNLCEQPIQIHDELVIPRCMAMIEPENVIDSIDLYYRGGVLEYANQNGRFTPSQQLTFVDRRRVLIEFRHGLGDAAQFTAVLRHLKQFRPQWRIDIATLQGKQSCFTGLADQLFVLNKDELCHDEYQDRFVLDWHECFHDHSRWPSTKVARCLLEVFRITPQPELCQYSILIDAETNDSVQEYLQALTGTEPNAEGRFPVVMIHYQGNTSQSKKDLSHQLIGQVCEDVIQQGYLPVILDWDNRSPLVDHLHIHNPQSSHPIWQGHQTGDAAVIAALIESSSLMIGIDSGPLHVAGATTTPTLGVWTKHHPIHFFDHAENVIHLVPAGHGDNAAGAQALDYFEQNYCSHVYEDLDVELRSQILSKLTGKNEPEIRETLLNQEFLKKLTVTAYNEMYYNEHKQAGLDYLVYGRWQQEYAQWIVESFALPKQSVLDVGCACGAIAKGFLDADVLVQGVDLNEFTVRQGREKWPELADFLKVCDAVHLHLYEDNSFDFIHSSQVAEHWKPELVPFILNELHRVTKPGGFFLCFLDTSELMHRQGRRLEHEDPTHVCLQPMSWWQQSLLDSGWMECSQEFQSAMAEHPLSYLSRYDWDWFIGRKL